jgi:hypothetical protein
VGIPVEANGPGMGQLHMDSIAPYGMKRRNCPILVLVGVPFWCYRNCAV